MLSIFRNRAATIAATAITLVVIMIGSEMKKKPYIAQFSEYRLSNHAQPTKNAETRAHNHHKTDAAAKTRLLLLRTPKMMSTTESATKTKTIGISMRRLALSVA